MNLDDGSRKFQLQLRADGRSPHTVAQYRRHVRRLGQWLEDEGRLTSLADIDHETLAQFLVSNHATVRPDGRPKLASSMNRLRSTLKVFFGYLYHAGYTDRDPGRLIRQARCGRPIPRALSDTDQKRLLAELRKAKTRAEVRDAVMFRTMLATGIRLGSAVALRWEDVDLEAGELRLRHAKGDREQLVRIDEGTSRELRRLRWKDAAGAVFKGTRGTELSSRTARSRFRMWCQRAGVAQWASPHSLRHSFASGRLNDTGDLIELQRALGHRSLQGTLCYLTDSK